MRRWTSVAKLSLLGAIALGVASCGAAKTQQGGSPQLFDAEPVENSGKRLAGDFVLTAIEDDYGPRSKHTEPQTIFSFDEKGTIKRQEKSRTEEGNYVIGARSELVIYIEKVNGEPLAAARIERYAITEEGEDAITLQSPSRKLTLRKH